MSALRQTLGIGDSGVSVVIPTYNRRILVGRAIESVLAQTRPAAEIIVVDDGSSDGTAAWLATYFGDQVTCVTQANQGVAAARNTGIMRAQHDLIAFLDSDDIWTPDKLMLQVPAMSDPSIVLSATNWRWQTEQQTDRFSRVRQPVTQKVHIDVEPMTRLCSRHGHGLLIQTCIVRRAVLQHLGGFNTTLRIAEDMDLLFRLADEGSFAVLSAVLMLRAADGTDGNLTKPASIDWRQENLDNTIGILRRCQDRNTQRSPQCMRALRRRLTQLQSYRAKLHAKSGEYAAARRLCLEGLKNAAPTKDALICAIGAVSPRVLNALYGRRRGA